jgi:hypothetical protein
LRKYTEWDGTLRKNLAKLIAINGKAVNSYCSGIISLKVHDIALGVNVSVPKNQTV